MVPTTATLVYPAPQAASSTSFSPPPLDGTLTIPEIYEHHLRHNADHPLFVYDAHSGTVTIKWRQAVQAIRKAAVITQRAVYPHLCTVPSGTRVVAILAINFHTSLS
ncbi:hypothetical protein H0H87_010855 [Tephrocybe sp. NHM501043]|nr:hypothetical protein H0H87_010855 [Tephrocybe sp. NHM501043]